MGFFKNSRKAYLLVAASFLLPGLLGTVPARPQTAAGPSGQATTQERIATEKWWPTSPGTALDAFAGSASCSKCHNQGIAPDTEPGISAMRRASVRAVAPIAKQAYLHYQGLTYSVTSGPAGIGYSVASGPHKLSQKLDWVIGAGELGQTFLYQADGRWYQSNMSHYTRLSALDLTTGLHVDALAPLPAALGTLLSPEDARSCFGCHTVHATSTAGFNAAHAEAGLGCEACHGPGRGHVQEMDDQTSAQTRHAVQLTSGASAIFDPARLAPADSIDFRGACHRSFADAALSSGPGAGTAVVRFQPYRLEESKCWRSTQDARLTCVACHDPHQPLNRVDASYDRQCLGCHSATAKVTAGAPSAELCPKSTKDCVSCHMPKVTLASMHGEFTDHFIRIARPGDLVPR